MITQLGVGIAFEPVRHRRITSLALRIIKAIAMLSSIAVVVLPNQGVVDSATYRVRCPNCEKIFLAWFIDYNPAKTICPYCTGVFMVANNMKSAWIIKEWDSDCGDLERQWRGEL